MNTSSRFDRLAWLLAAYGVLLLAVSGALFRAASLTAAVPVMLAAVAVVFFGVLGATRFRFQVREREEEEEFEAFKREHASSSDLFEGADERLRLVRRTHRQFMRFLVPSATALGGAGLLISAMASWRRWGAQGAFPVADDNPLAGAAVCALFVVMGLVLGSYANGASRETERRWLRPAAQWVFLSSLFFLLAGAVLVGEDMGFHPECLDAWTARTAVALLGALGVELIASVVFDFYRPRTSWQADRPLAESRLLSLFTEPGGLAHNMALALDYQFGFNVSEAWFYRFLERSLLPFFALAVGCFWLLTSIVVIESEEQGIRERFGNVVRETPLQPGFYLKLPWPMARIYTFPVQRVQELAIGYQRAGEDVDEESFDLPPEMVGDTTGRVIVWSKAHNKQETKFVTATEMIDLQEGPGEQVREKPVPVYFISASVPLYYRVNNLYDYAYRHTDPAKTLARLATREVVRYLAQDDFFNIMRNLESGGKTLRRNIQTAANGVQLGVDIVFVGLQGLHPPVEVGGRFDDVVAALEDKHRLVLEAEKDAIVRGPRATAEAIRTVTEAKVYRTRRTRLAVAESARFLDRLAAYQASPRMYVVRSFLTLLEEKAPTLRKYVTAPFEGTEVFIFNLEEKLRPDLLDVELDTGEAEQ